MPTKAINLPTQIDLDQFISVQAHDLRTPFNHIIGFSKMTLNTVGNEPLTNYQKEDLGTVYRSGLRALSLMNGLIDIARLNRHEKELNLSEANIQQMLDQSLAQWKKNNPANEAEVEVRLLATASTIRADEQLVRQIISGFITYVALFCEPKQKITLTVEETPGQFVFSFSSSGVRTHLMPSLDLDMVGYVYRAFVELHSGKILAAEENDEGALVRFSLDKP
jgi:signal transduction histidine kinase